MLFTNTAVVEAQEVFSGGELLDLDIPRGGGTELTSAIDYLEENGIQADLHLCFTDGEFAGGDYQILADNNVIIVLDRNPNSWNQRYIDASGVKVIVASDAPLAA